MSEKSRELRQAWHNEDGDDRTWWIDRDGLENCLTPESRELMQELARETDIIAAIRTISELLCLNSRSMQKTPIRYSEKTGKAIEFEWVDSGDRWKSGSDVFNLVASYELRQELQKEVKTNGPLRVVTNRGDIVVYHYSTGSGYWADLVVIDWLRTIE